MSENNRYDRQKLISQIGEEGQKKLLESRVTVIGCGGLGSPVLTYLAMAGVGHIRMIDCDIISSTNLNRQFFYEESSVGRAKCEEAAEFLRKRNSEIVLESIHEKLTEENAEKLLKDADVVVDCVDSISVRKIVGRACRKIGISLIEGGINGFYGYVLPINPGKSACLECIETGTVKEVLPVPAVGAVAGVIGSLQAVECLKILLGIPVSYGTMLQYDGIYSEFDSIPVMTRKDCSCQKTLNVEE